MGLATTLYGEELTGNNEESESKKIEFKDESLSSSSATVSGNGEKTKRGVVKISNADHPSFNYLSSSSSSSSNVVGAGASGNNGVYKSLLSPNVPPFRYIQNNNYQQPFAAGTYVQPSQHSAAQFASQYSFQTSPLTHYFQTPNQLQYVSPSPAVTVTQAPLMKFQTFNGKEFSSSGGVTSDYSSSASVPQHSVQSHQSSTAVSKGSSASVSASADAKQLPLYQMAQPFYYTQQPFFMFFVQPQTSAAATNFLYQQQQPGFNYFFKQQPQFYTFPTSSQFGVYPTGQANQVSF